MLRSMKDLDGLAVEATDGAIDHVKDFYFDNSAWVVRYLVVETGSWLSSRKVLISPISMGHPDWGAKTLPVSITKEQVKNSPEIDTERPVPRQHETEYLGYYGYPLYWGGGGLWGAGDPHLRSCQAVIRYHIHATDGDIGHAQGYLVDDETWAIRYVVVNTSDRWLGHEVNIAREWIKDVCWSDASITVDRTREAVKDALLDEPSGSLIASNKRVSIATIRIPPTGRKCRDEEPRYRGSRASLDRAGARLVGPARTYSLRVNAFPE